MNEFNVFTKYPNHVFDESQGWHFDPSLRVECFDMIQSQDCCPTIQVTSNSYGSTFFPQLMGTYIMSNDYQVSGRRIYRSQSNDFLVYLHDWGPSAGMEWTFAPRLGRDIYFYPNQNY